MIGIGAVVCLLFIGVININFVLISQTVCNVLLFKPPKFSILQYGPTTDWLMFFGYLGITPLTKLLQIYFGYHHTKAQNGYLIMHETMNYFMN